MSPGEATYERTTTYISLHWPTVERLRALQAALNEPDYDALITRLIRERDRGAAPPPPPSPVSPGAWRRVRKLRLAAGVSQQDLASRLGVSSPTLCKLELYGQGPRETVSRALEVLDALQVHP